MFKNLLLASDFRVVEEGIGPICLVYYVIPSANRKHALRKHSLSGRHCC